MGLATTYQGLGYTIDHAGAARDDDRMDEPAYRFARPAA
jgi:hypothetical protein